MTSLAGVTEGPIFAIFKKWHVSLSKLEAGD